MKKNDTVSIIIAAWNSYPYIKLCIESIIKYTHHPYELVVVDNGSTDKTKAYLRDLKGITLIENKKNLGNPKAVNQAAKRIKSKYFMLLDSDTVVSSSWLSDLVAVMKSERKIGQLTCNSNTIIDEEKEFQGVSFASWTKFEEKNMSRSPLSIFNKYYKDYDNFVGKVNRKFQGVIEIRECPPWFLGGWCVLMPTALIDRIGGFVYDEKFKYAYYEDVDLSWRIGVAGLKLAVARNVFVHHFINSTTVKLPKKPQEYAGVNRDIFMEKWEKHILTQLRKKSGGEKEKLKDYIESDYILTHFLKWYGAKSIMQDW
jgi:GT2 family glycosyltransferase